MKTTIIILVILTSCCIHTNAIRRKTEIQRQILDGLVRLITKKSFPPLLQEIKRYCKKENIFQKLITDAVIWKSDQINRVFKMVRNKVDAVESVLWLLFQTKSKPKGRPQWQWLDSNYDWTKRARGMTKISYDGGNQNYNNDNDNNVGDYNGQEDGDDGDDDDGGDDGDDGDDGDNGAGGNDGGDNGRGDAW